jgi:serine/threonine-protein kinase RsbW
MKAGSWFGATGMEELGEMMAFIDSECARTQVPDDAAFAIRLAAEEVFVNIVKHGYGSGSGPVRITFDRDGDRVTLTMVDEAPPFDPLEAPAPDLDSEIEDRDEGGLGWHLVRQIMDEVHHQLAPGRGNTVKLVKHLGESNED